MPATNGIAHRATVRARPAESRSVTASPGSASPAQALFYERQTDCILRRLEQSGGPEDPDIHAAGAIIWPTGFVKDPCRLIMSGR